MRNFDQWTEELSKQRVVQCDEEETKPGSKAGENSMDEEFEEEE